jgi:hypothetical protein
MVIGSGYFSRLSGEPVTIERHRTIRWQRVDHVSHVACIMSAKPGVAARPSLVQKQGHLPSVQRTECRQLRRRYPELVPDVFKHGSRNIVECIQRRAGHSHESQLNRRSQTSSGTKSAPQQMAIIAR